MTTAEVAKVLKVSKTTVINYAKNDLLRFERTAGRQRRFEADSVEELRRVLKFEDDSELEASLADLARRNQDLRSQNKPPSR